MPLPMRIDIFSDTVCPWCFIGKRRFDRALRLRPNIKRTPIFGVGCAGGAIGLSRAADYTVAYPKQTAAILAVETCSLTVQRDDLSTVNVIAAGLFGDGAAAAIVAGLKCFD